jgi:hypothetical protein
MSQLSLYLDNDTFARLSSAAKENGQSLSRYTAAIINEHFSAKAHTNEEAWQTLRELYDSAEPDETFLVLDDVPQSNTEKTYLRYAGALSDESRSEIEAILQDARRVDINEW